MSTNSYIRATGDIDYNFNYNDFTVEFFVKPVPVSPLTSFSNITTTANITAIDNICPMTAGDTTVGSIDGYGPLPIISLPIIGDELVVSAFPSPEESYVYTGLISNNFGWAYANVSWEGTPPAGNANGIGIPIIVPSVSSSVNIDFTANPYGNGGGSNSILNYIAGTNLTATITCNEASVGGPDSGVGEVTSILLTNIPGTLLVVNGYNTTDYDIYSTGDASLNPDNVVHTNVTWDGIPPAGNSNGLGVPIIVPNIPATVTIAFNLTYGGGLFNEGVVQIVFSGTGGPVIFGNGSCRVDFISTGNIIPIIQPTQTLFEISNNESPAANLYTSTRFLTVIENGNLNSYAIQIISPFVVGGNSNVFTSPIPISNNDKIFYNGELLNDLQLSISGSSISLSNVNINTSNTIVEIGQVLFQVLGEAITENTQHFISAERSQNQFYLFLDGQLQSAPVPAFNAIPSQVLTNTISNSNIQRYDSPALLTIGANKDGKDPFYGQFGDFKIINGTAIHIPETEITNTIYSSFNDANLGCGIADIIVEDDNFVDSITNNFPEEYIPGQIFDTLYIQVYQSNTSNANANILSFSLFKPTIMVGPTGYYTFTMSTSNSKINLPWSFLDAAAASILVNGVAIPSTSWAIDTGVLSIVAAPGSNVQIFATGPTTYYDVNSNSVSIITSNLYANSSTINVANTTPFITPIIGSTANISNNALLNVRGQIFINQECITYLYIDRIGNTLSGLTRGTSGTGVPEIHNIGSRIISSSYTNDIQNLAFVDPRTASWYTYPLANTSLQNTNSTISSVLVNLGGLPPVTPF